MKKKILVMCPTGRERRALPPVAARLGYDLDFDEVTGGAYSRDFEYGKRINVKEIIDAKVEEYRNQSLSGVVASVGFPGMTAISAEIARRLGLPGPSPEVILRCEHKYYSRLAQKEFVPDATPDFALFDPESKDDRDPALLGFKYPFFLKPVKSILSYGAARVDSHGDFLNAIKAAALPEGFLGPFHQLLEDYTDFEEDAHQLIVEDLLQGIQVSMEGFVFRKEVKVMAVVEAVMVPDTLSFARWYYPGRLPDDVRARMEDVAVRFFCGVGYDNAPFNMELMYNPDSDSIHIIEVNAKLANQFCDMVEKVDGYNPFEVMLKIALGEEPQIKSGEGPYKVAASCVFREFEDRTVVSVPGQPDIDKVVHKYPASIIEILAEPGKRLSEQFQDSDSYRYALANIGADSFEEIEEKFADIKGMLPFDMRSPQLAASIPQPVLVSETTG